MIEERTIEALERIIATLRQAADDVEACVVMLGGSAPGRLPTPGVDEAQRCTCGHPQRVHTRRRGELPPGIVCVGFGCRCTYFAPAGELETT